MSTRERRGNVITKVKNENRERRSPRMLRTKTPSINELRKKFKVSPKGKRKLNFLSKGPLAGKSFYLDLQGYRHLAQLKKAIKELSGAVEEFFHKDVNYLVTNRKDTDNGKSPSSHSTPSPGTPSPLLIPQSSSVKGTAVPSPMSTDSPQSVDSRATKPSHNTRGQAICQSASAGQKRGTTNVLSNANTWGVNVFHVDRVIKWFAQLMPKTRQADSGKQQSSSTTNRAIQGKVPKVVALQDSFLKVEDLSFKYRPQVHEFKVWPEITFDGSVICPFDPPRRRSSEKKSSKRNQKVESKTFTKIPVQSRPNHGYCECCEVRYSDLDSHLKGEQHQNFAKTDSNYASLEKAINDGPTIQDFLNEIRLKRNKIGGNKIDNDEPKLLDFDEGANDELCDDVFLLSSPVKKSSRERSKEKLPSEKLLGHEVNSGLKTLDKNMTENKVCGNIVREKSSSMSKTLSAVVNGNWKADCKKPRLVARSLGSQKQSIFDAVEEKRTLSEVSYNHWKNSDKLVGNTPDGNMENAIALMQDFRSKQVKDEEDSTCSVTSVKLKADQDKPDDSKRRSKNSKDDTAGQPFSPEHQVQDENVEVNGRNSCRRKQNLDLQLSPILPCSPPLGRSVLSSCSEDGNFPPGLPIYSSLGSSFGDVSKDVNFLVNRIENHSNSDFISENTNAIGPDFPSSPVSGKTLRSPTFQSLCPGSAYFGSDMITGHDSIGNENDFPLVKRKRSPGEDEVYNKARKCKRVSEGTEISPEENLEGDFYRSSVAERVKLQRAIVESMQGRDVFSSEAPESSPMILRTCKRRDAFTSSPFSEITNKFPKRRERAKSDGKSLNVSRRSEKSPNIWNDKRRGKQPRSACLTPNDPFSFNDL